MTDPRLNGARHDPLHSPLVSVEVTMKTLDDEVSALAQVYPSQRAADLAYGALLAIKWIRDGASPPSRIVTRA
jgi:hypothetical protein